MQLFFDFDGTLADSSPGIYMSFELACSRLGLIAPAYEVFCDSIGPPVQRLARQFFPLLTDAQVETFRQAFREDYDNHRFRQCRWYAGVEATLKTLAEQEHARMAIITNKPTRPTLELLKAGEIAELFELVVGIDYPVFQGTGPAFAGKAEAIKFAHSQLDNSSPGGIYVGDTPEIGRAHV